MKAETINKFENIIGKEFQYKGHIIKIASYKSFPSGTVVVTSDLKNFNLWPNEFEAFFNSLLPIDPTIPINEINNDKIQFPSGAAQTKKTEKPENLPLTQNEEIEDKASSPNEVYNPISESKAMKENLMAMMDLVKSNPNSLAQAKAMVEIANSIVGIQKNEIQVFQMMNKHNPKTPEKSNTKLLK